MKGLILCGGAGTRLLPFTFSIPKQLIPVANKPVLYYILDTLKQINIREIGIVVGSRDGVIQKRLETASSPGINFTFIVQEEPRGLAHAVKTARPFLENSDFVMVLGDNLYEQSLQEAQDIFTREKADALACLTPVDEPWLYGIAEVKNGRIVSLEEKPANPRSNLAITGIYFFKGSIFAAVDRIKPSQRGELEITDAMAELIKMGKKVIPYRYPGWWMDIGRPEDVLRANREVLKRLFGTGQVRPDTPGEKAPFSSSPFLEKPIFEATLQGDRLTGGSNSGSSSYPGDSFSKNFFPRESFPAESFPGEASSGAPFCCTAPSAVISGSRLEGPLVIGENCRITDSFIGPYTSIGSSSVIEDSHVENSVLFEGVKIKNMRKPVRESILGEGAGIWGKKGIGREPKKFLLGAGSLIYL